MENLKVITDYNEKEKAIIAAATPEQLEYADVINPEDATEFDEMVAKIKEELGEDSFVAQKLRAVFDVMKTFTKEDELLRSHIIDTLPTVEYSLEELEEDCRVED